MTRSYLLTWPVAWLAFAFVLTACYANEPAFVEPSPTPKPAQPQSTVVATEPSTVSPSTSTPAPTPTPEFTIVPLLPFDAIPSIDDPEFLSPDVADTEYNEEELVLGIEINGDARAYSIPFLSSHEIVNDVVGGKPVAVTW
ncbi:MAG: DUF3179 domain-containing protein [Chloroflexi bacterium]|nr:DUF3179 domain-containing protein [Chloroflexota bacterium]